MAQEGTGENWRAWHTSGAWWEKLKPLAREHRHEPTRAEHMLWQKVRGRRLQWHKFRRQHMIERFIVDFICTERRLIVEVDGEIHQYTVEEGALRKEFLVSLGFRVIRFTNDEVFTSIDRVLDLIAAAAALPIKTNSNE
jgi:very-short-patch-repair endonuclease